MRFPRVFLASIAIVAGVVLGAGCTSLDVGKHDITTVQSAETNAEPRGAAKKQGCSLQAWILGPSETSNRGLHELGIVITNNGPNKECLVSGVDEYRVFLIDESGLVFANPSYQQKKSQDIVFSCATEWLEPKQSSYRRTISIEGSLGTKPPAGTYTVIVIRVMSSWQGQLLVSAPLKITIE